MSLTILTPLGALLAVGVVVPLVALTRARRKAGSVREVLGVAAAPSACRRRAARRARDRRGAARSRGGAAGRSSGRETEPCGRMPRRSSSLDCLALDAGAARRRRRLSDSSGRRAAATSVRASLSGRPRRGRVAHRSRAPASLPERRTRRSSRRRSSARSGSSSPPPRCLVRDGSDVVERARDASRAPLLHAEVDVAARDRPDGRREPAGVERPTRRSLPSDAGDRGRLRPVLGRGRARLLTGRARAAVHARPLGARGARPARRVRERGGVLRGSGRRGAQSKARELLGSGPSVVEGEQAGQLALAPYLAAAALFPFGLLLWRRDR